MSFTVKRDSLSSSECGNNVDNWFMTSAGYGTSFPVKRAPSTSNDHDLIFVRRMLLWKRSFLIRHAGRIVRGMGNRSVIQ